MNYCIEMRVNCFFLIWTSLCIAMNVIRKQDKCLLIFTNKQQWPGSKLCVYNNQNSNILSTWTGALASLLKVT